MPTQTVETPPALQIRTDVRAGAYWQYVPNLTKNNKQYACPAACPTGWTGGADVAADLCECN